MSPSTDPSIETSTCTSLPLCFSRVNPSTDSIADRCIRRWSAGTTLGRMDGEPVAPFPGLGCYRGPEAAGRAVARYRRSGPGVARCGAARGAGGWRAYRRGSVGSLTRRLERLQARVAALGGGELARVEVEGNDEIAELARTFNRAAAQIERLVRAERQILARLPTSSVHP